MTPPPRFDDLVENDLPAVERERLLQAHEALVAAGPPPELSERLRRTPMPPRSRRRVAGLALAAALAAAAFAGGFALGGDGRVGFSTEAVLAMDGTEAAPAAQAKIHLGEIDDAGNWPMAMEVSGLPDGLYELLLTRDGEPAVSCGTFLVHGDTRAYLNAPYKLKQFDGWIVTRPGSDRALLRTDEI